jgi:hypothetical protein
MDGNAFVAELEAFQAERLASITAAGEIALTEVAGDAEVLLKVALANEVSVSELAGLWIPTTRELDVKLAFAKQAGDEARHFETVAERLAALGFDASAFTPPPDNALFAHLKTLATTVERIAAGLFTLEAIAYGVNERFMALCAARGDDETVRIYREYIQPDEQAHQRLGGRLLAKYASTPELQAVARATVAKVLEIAGAARAQAAARLGTACFPGC